jgi:hypothetical protein
VSKVEIDYEDRGQVERLAALIRLNGGGRPYADLNAKTCATEADATAAALRMLAAPPKEPTGLDARVRDRDGHYWALVASHMHDARWGCVSSVAPVMKWADLLESFGPVEVLS